MRALLAVLALGLLGTLSLSSRTARDDAPPPPRPAAKTQAPRQLTASADGTGVRVVDVRTGSARRIELGVPPRVMAWTGTHRLVVARLNELYEIDARAGKVTRSELAPGDVVAIARRGDGYVTVQARRGRAVLYAGDIRIPVPGIRASAEPRHMIVPGLAVDGDTAHVVDAVQDRVATIDIPTRSVRVEPMGRPRASRRPDATIRHAAHLGDGRIAVSGHRDMPSGERVPYGLRVIDLRARRTFMLAPRQTELAAGRRHVVAWRLRGGGIAIHGRGGSRTPQHRLLRGRRVHRVEVIGGRAYVRAVGHDVVVALASGKVLRRSRARTVLGVAYPGGGKGRIAHYDPLTLRRQDRGAVVHGYLWDWDRAPGGGRVALAVSGRGRIEVFHTRGPGRIRRIEVGLRMPARALRWATPDRIVALAGEKAFEVDVRTGRVVSRRSLGGRLYGFARTSDGLAALAGPADGEASLLLLRAGQAPRRIPLAGVQVRRRTREDVRPDGPPELYPGLAVDGGVAYVAPAGAGSIVRVDLATGAATSHALRATAAKGGSARTRVLQALGGGKLLFTGQDLAADGRERAFSSIVDTATWTERRLGDRFAGAVGTRAGIVVPRYEERFLTVHAPDGRRLARHRPRYGISAVRVHGRHAYVANAARAGRNHRTHVIDLRTGRRLRVLPFSTIPHLLTRP